MYQKTTQVIAVKQSEMGPPSQSAERIAFYDPNGNPVDFVSKVVLPAKASLSNNAGTVAVDASVANVFDLTLTASGWTIANPSNPTDGQEITLRIQQDATGSRTLAGWGTNYDFGGIGGSAPTLTTTASKIDVLKFQYHAGVDKWLGIAKALNE